MEKTVARPTQRGRTAVQVLAELRDPILLGLSRVLRAAFASSIDELLERLLAERSWDMRQKIDDSLDLLRNGREGIEAKFDQACSEEWASRTGQRERRGDSQFEPRDSRRSEPKLSALSLVDDTQIGDQLTVGRVASRIRRRLDEEQVDGLRARFGLLLDRDWFSDNDFPIAPDVILECLRKALSAFGPAPVVAFLLDQFESKLSAELAALYAEVNELLVKRGVMPEIRYHVAKPPMGGGQGGGLDGAEAVDDGEMFADGQAPAGYAEAQGGSAMGPGGADGGMPMDPRAVAAMQAAAMARAGAVAGAGPHGGSYAGAMGGQPGLPGYPGQAGHPGHPGYAAHPGQQRHGGQPGAAGHGGVGGGGQVGPGGIGGIGGAGVMGGAGGRGDFAVIGNGQDGAARQFFGSDSAAGGDPAEGGGHGGGGNYLDAGGSAGGLAGAVAGQGAPAMMPAPAVRSLVIQMGRRDPTAQGSAARYLSDPTRFGVRHANLPPVNQPLIAALNVLQEHQPPEGRNVAEQGDKVRENSVEVAEEHGTPLERLIIETVSLVFDNVYEDPAIADSIKQQLLRLQVAAFKAALIDPSFFARPEHPMRRLIDRIASMGSDPDFETGQGTPLVSDVADLVTWILANFDRDLAVIEDALARLETLVEAETDRRAERLAKIATAAARTERLERTRDEVRAELTASIRRNTPEFVARFIADQWTEVISRLRNGADYAPFDEGRARRTVEKLIWSVAPKRAVEIRKLAADLPQLIADLSRGLSFVATSEAERELFFSELLAWHGAAIGEAKRQAAEREAQRRAGQSPAPEPDIEDDDFEADDEMPPIAGAGAGGRAAPEVRRRASDHHDGADSRQDGDDQQDDTQAGDRDDGGSDAGDDTRSKARDDEPESGMDAVEALDLVNGAEIELLSVKGEIKRFKLGWMSPARSVFIFSCYPKDHWTVRRPMLSQLLEQGRIRVVSRPAKTNQVIEALKSRG